MVGRIKIMISRKRIGFAYRLRISKMLFITLSRTSAHFDWLREPLNPYSYSHVLFEPSNEICPEEITINRGYLRANNLAVCVAFEN